MDSEKNNVSDVPKPAWMGVGSVASEIYCSVVVELMTSRGKPWDLKTQDLMRIAERACVAENVFVEAINANQQH
jgi:hypothetical protein